MKAIQSVITIVSVIFFMLFGVVSLMAQQVFPAAGGTAIGFGGSVSYSVGQTFYQLQTDSTGEVRQGVQQPYEIFSVSTEHETSIPISLNAYPNPTQDVLTLDISSAILTNYSARLHDMQGKLLENKIITDNHTRFSVGYLPTGTYLLNVSHENKVVKVFRIVKR
jgi:hypothetical protein